MYQDFYTLTEYFYYQLVFIYVFQDLPEHFEENMEKWMKNFLILLTIDSKQLNLEVLFFVNFVCWAI